MTKGDPMRRWPHFSQSSERGRTSLRAYDCIDDPRRDRTRQRGGRFASRGAGDPARLAELLARFGTALRATGDLAGARDTLEQARRAGDDSADVLSELAQTDAGLGRPDQARPLFLAVVDRNPAAPTSWFNLGLFELQNRRPADAAAALRRATVIDPSYGDAWNALGAALATTDPRDAVDAWRHAERLLPGDYDLLFNLAMTLADSDHPQEALPYLQRFARDAPRERYAGDIANVHARIQLLGGREE